jgi:hypothetical protein
MKYQLKVYNFRNWPKQFSLSQYLIFSIYIIVTLINLQFRQLIPINAGSNSPHDDLLGIRLANSLINGGWLGTWDNLTLAKPPGYSFYLFFAHYLPFQFAVINQFMFCSAALMFVLAIRSLLSPSFLMKNFLPIVLYVLLIFNPYLFGSEMSRAYRTSAHTILVFFYCVIFFKLSKTIELYNLEKDAVLSFRRDVSKYIFLLAITYVGLILLRSESYWIFVASIPYIILLLFLKFRTINKLKNLQRAYLKTIKTYAIVAILAYIVPISLVGQINNVKYGTSLIENYYSGNFAKAIKDWQRVDSGKDKRAYVIVSKDQREAVYKVSNNAALLRESLELNPGQGWQTHACNAPIQLCDNSGGWFTWQLRDAAISTGLIGNEIQFQTFFKKISEDIQDACDNKIFACGGSSLGVGVKSFQELPLSTIANYSISNILSASPTRLKPSGLVATPDQYGASSEVVALYHKVIKYPSSPAGSGFVSDYSSNLQLLQSIYFPIQNFISLISLIGFVLAWRTRIRRVIYTSLAFGLTAILLNSIGVSIAQVSFGWRVEGPYLLPIQTIIQFLTLVGIVSIIKQPKINLKLGLYRK